MCWRRFRRTFSPKGSRHTEEFHDDRGLTQAQDAAFAQQHQASGSVLEFTYDVFDDLPISDRVSILREKPSISAQISADGPVEVTGVLGVQPVMDLVWHHVRLLKVKVDGGPTLELADVLERFDQLRLATAWMGAVLTDWPDARFLLTGTLQEYASPLPENQWLLPAFLSV